MYTGPVEGGRRAVLRNNSEVGIRRARGAQHEKNQERMGLIRYLNGGNASTRAVA